MVDSRLLAGLLLAASIPVPAMTFHVPSAEYPTIQSGIDAAGPGDSVLVAPGTYMGEGNKDLDFGGTELVLLSENGADVTIIDCEGEGRGLHFHSGESNAAEVIGFTIRNGHSEFGSSGAGLRCENSSPMISDCVIRDCRMDFGVGGGLGLWNNSSPRLVRCSILRNSAQQGGGGMFLGNDCNAEVRDCTINANETDLAGGGAVLIQESSPTIDGCLISGNTAETGAGLSVISLSTVASPQIASTTITGNHSSEWGGGIRTDLRSTAALTQTVIWGNCADAGGDEIYLMNTGGAGGATTLICCAVDSSGVSGDEEVVYIGDQVFTDPLFCGPLSCDAAPTDGGDYTLGSSSPCLPKNSPCGGLIGALGEGCETPSPSVRTTWGRIKAGFRE